VRHFTSVEQLKQKLALPPRQFDATAMAADGKRDPVRLPRGECAVRP
jgi:hypothetical protein